MLSRETFMGYELLVRQIQFAVDQIDPNYQFHINKIILFRNDAFGISQEYAARLADDVVLQTGAHSLDSIDMAVFFDMFS